ncbi:1192_t:CDS:2 [Entrophospora sp. SA101]|nr:1192_t:CDS:2 [Entrophospora sp. SA101]
MFDLFFKKHADGEIRFPRELENKYIVSDKILGKGSFAVVKECTEKRSNKNYALKIILKESIKVHHKYITSLHDLYETKDGVFIITDLASGGELFNQLLLKGSYTEEDAANLMKQLLEGVQYLHDLDIVHRDLKPENLLFKDKSDEADIMITDFGLSKILKSEDDVLLTACGTPGYIAPEVLLQAGYGKPIDIWSIGVIMYTMLCGYTPFWGEDQAALFESIMSGEYEYEEEYWSEISDLAKDLIDKLLTYEPHKRITVHEALKHPWFESANKINILEKVKSNLSAKDRFKRAIHLVQDINRMLKNKNSTNYGDDNDYELINEKEIAADLLRQDQKQSGEKKIREQINNHFESLVIENKITLVN